MNHFLIDINLANFTDLFTSIRKMVVIGYVDMEVSISDGNNEIPFKVVNTTATNGPKLVILHKKMPHNHYYTLSIEDLGKISKVSSYSDLYTYLYNFPLSFNDLFITEMKVSHKEIAELIRVKSFLLENADIKSSKVVVSHKIYRV